MRKAGLKIMGFVCESDALLDPMKDEIEEFTQYIIAGLQDSESIVKEAACETIGDFSDNALEDFLDQRDQVLPVLFNVLEEYQTLATQSDEHAHSASRAISALSEFIANMEDYDVMPHLERSLQICSVYLTGEGQRREVKYETLKALSSIIIAADETIMPKRDDLLNAFHAIIKSEGSI